MSKTWKVGDRLTHEKYGYKAIVVKTNKIIVEISVEGRKGAARNRQYNFAAQGWNRDDTE